MSKDAFEKKGPCCDKLQLDAEIRELMISLEKQNSLLSGYYQKLIRNDGEGGKTLLHHVTDAAAKQDS